MVAPQGFRVSGDVYTARYDEVIKDVENCKRCVDDTILFENSIEENFFKTCEYVHLVGSHGIILNKEYSCLSLTELHACRSTGARKELHFHCCRSIVDVVA